MDTQKLIDYWLIGADKDWLACQHLYENKDYPQCLFWGHLVLEKTLKALVVQATQKQAPFTHDLVMLAKVADLPLDQTKRDQLNEINTFNQFGRYDNEITTFVQKCDSEYTGKYFAIIKQLYLWLMENFHNKN